MIIDTNILVDVTRGHEKAKNFLLTQVETIKISRVSAMELLQGCHDKRDFTLIVKLFLGTKAEIIEISESISRLGGKIYDKFYLSHGVGIIDAFIAATALELDEILATRNTKHYQFIPKLKLLVPYH